MSTFRPTGPISSADGTLIIVSCKAKHLPNRRKLEKQNPYVLLRIGSVADRSSYDFRGGQTPEWNHESRFELSVSRPPLLKLDVLDDTRGEPAPIGSTEIDCSPVFNRAPDGRYLYDDWFPLTLLGKLAGIIRLEMTFYPLIPIPGSRAHSSHREAAAMIAPAPSRAFQSVATATAPRCSHAVAPVAASMQTLSRPYPLLMDECDPPSRPLRSVSPVSSIYQINNNAPTLPQSKSSKIISKLTRKWNQPTDKAWARDAPLDPSTAPPSPPSQRDVLDLLEKQVQTNVDRLSLLASPPAIPPKHHPRARATPSPTLGVSSFPNGSFEAPPPPPVRHSVSQFRTSGQERRQSPPPLTQAFSSPSPPSQQRKIPSHHGPLSTHSPLAFSHGVAHPRRKPPSASGSSPTALEVPYSADQIGAPPATGRPHWNAQRAREPTPPGDIYFLGDKLGDSLNKHNHPTDEYDPSHFAPTPLEHFTKSQRIQLGREYMRKDDLAVDYGASGYQGDGTWASERAEESYTQYLSRKSHNPIEGFESYSRAAAKPGVPPKVPLGMTEKEYYLLERQSYLKDMHGRRL